VPKGSKSAKQATPKHRPITDLVPAGVESINSLMLTNTATGYRVKMLVIVDGRGYWIDAPVRGTVSMV
jgi:hypothetical protein